MAKPYFNRTLYLKTFTPCNMLQWNKPGAFVHNGSGPLRCSDPVSIDCQSFAFSLVDLLCRWRGGWFIQFAPQQRLYLRPLPQGHGSLRPTFFPVGVLAASPRCLRAFQNSCMPLMA